MVSAVGQGWSKLSSWAQGLCNLLCTLYMRRGIWKGLC